MGELDERSILLVLQEMGAQMREDLPVGEETVRTEDEARLLLAQLVREHGGRDIDPAAIAGNEPDAEVLAQRSLGLFAADPATAPLAQALVQDPPQDEQLVVETAILAAVVLGSLVTWLQTKVHIKVKRAGGKTSFEFSLDKDAADAETVKAVAQQVAKLLP
ncbi:hypothetical protein [Actinoplanes sp. L3-i22]|uniref:hypothetical protein n=1 Tax=Actinoplanes sp. L3-i22 TaxID=2836373 RepID=UPI001C783FB4|nr:hypothetical protein [Actinoplanes sp. L3-i22]BCY08917.1 hypothetical protein L3i22_040050 [Actinoplanes sp. L3-i22]